MGGLLVRRLDPHDARDMDEFQRVYVEAESAANPGGRLYSREQGVAALTSKGAWFGEGYGAFVGDELVGEVMVMGSRRDNTDRGTVMLWVSPDHARRGVGSGLLALAEDRFRELGRSVVDAEVQLGTRGRPGYGAFAERHGYRLVQRSIERRLDLPVAGDLLDRLEAEARPCATGYEVRVVDGPVPADLATGYVTLLNRMNLDMPTGDVELEEGRRTIDDIAVQDAQLADAGMRRVTAFALAPAEEGPPVVAGFSSAAVSGPGSDHIAQSGTIVGPEHRGHRLGMLVKIAQIRALEEGTDKAWIHTDNAETNAHMVGINEALGFRITSTLGQYEKPLA